MLILASGRSESGWFMSSSKGATRVRKHQIMLSSTPADERNCKRTAISLLARLLYYYL